MASFWQFCIFLCKNPIGVLKIGQVTGFAQNQPSLIGSYRARCTAGPIIKLARFWHWVSVGSGFRTMIQTLLRKMLSTKVLKGILRWFSIVFEAAIVESLDFPRRFSNRLKNCFFFKQMNASGTVFGENHLRNTTRQTRLGCNRGDLPSGHEHVTYFYFLLFIKKIH